jgi:probable rRNA maturation factor
MMYGIEFQINLENVSIPEMRMREAITSALDLHEIDPATTLTVVVTDDVHVRDLNRQFRGIDTPTDVLSFPADPLPERTPDTIDEETEAPYLGDLIIAYPYTQQQALEADHELDDELVLLVVHGTLHLLGYDHDSAENEADMWATQAELLTLASVPIEVPRFTFEDDTP